MTILLYSALAVTGFGVIWALWGFNRLVDLEFSRFPDRWVADGRPNGGKLSRAQASFWRSGFARNRVISDWLVKTPGWVRGNPEAESLLARFRTGMVIMLGGVLTFFGVALLGT
jgi:hypothetical protein